MIICRRCVLDNTAKKIIFDDNGICNYCKKYDELSKKYILISEKKKRKELEIIISKIKKLGRNREYDCILGLSGGVDSSYLALLCNQFNLRPLVVHFDNGWNRDIAVNNINKIVKLLNYDLQTYVINWEEFRDLQISYLKSSVVDAEVPTDYFIFSVLYKIASKFNIKYILSGYNYVTEFGMPDGWNYNNKFDTENLKDIHKKYGNLKLKNFPKLSIYHRFYYEKILGIERVALLNLINYNKKDAKNKLKKIFDWKEYGGKHHESIFTRFYQDYILPKKFNIDKRKAHWSALICSGQATRKEAIEDLKMEPYSLEEQQSDKKYVLKKLGLSNKEFGVIMKSPEVKHIEFRQENPNSFLFTLFRITLKIPEIILRKVRYIKATGKWKG